MSVPIRIEVGGLSKKNPVCYPTSSNVPVAHERAYNTLGGSSTSSWIDTSHDDDLHSRFDNDRWFEDMRRRFDERQRQWDAEIRQMKSSFFTTPALPAVLPPSSPQPELAAPATECPILTSYERREDGRQHFLVRSDVQDFDQNDVSVSVRDGQIVVTASRRQRSGNSSSTKQITRTVDLPKCVDEGLISASISADKILLIDAPLRQAITSPTFSSISDGSGTSDLATPSSVSGTIRSGRMSSSSSLPTKTLSITSAKQMFHVEIPVGGDYLPNEIRIRTFNNRVYISARHEECLSTRSTFREFSKEYDIPDHIDPKSIGARLEHGILHLEGSALH